MKKHIKIRYRDGAFQYSRVVRYERYIYDREMVKTGKVDSYFRPIWEWVEIAEKRVSHYPVCWGNWIPDESSRWHYYHDGNATKRSLWRNNKTNFEKARQDRREGRINYKVRKNPGLDCDPWDGPYHSGGRTWNFKSWKHATKHRKQWMKNLEC